MTTDATVAGTVQLGELSVTRMGYGTMRLAGPGVWGPPQDLAEASVILRQATAFGITHLDTADYYGPHTVNELIRTTLAPYPEDLVLVTKVGARRDARRGWPPALSRAELISAVHDNLRNLGVDALDVVNLRLGDASGGFPVDVAVAEPFSVLAELREQGLIRHLGLSHVTVEQLEDARKIAPVVCVQNAYNVGHRVSDDLLDRCTELGITFVPYFPLGGFEPLHWSVLGDCAEQAGATPAQVALAWLLQRSPVIAVIPGTSSLAHLKQNIAAGALELPADVVARLDALG